MAEKEKPIKVVLTPARVAEVDEAIWLRAREGDVAAAKVMYARLAETQPAAEAAPMIPPTFAELEAMFRALQEQQKNQQEEGVSNVSAIVDDGGNVGADAD